MKARVIGAVLVLGVLVALAYLTESTDNKPADVSSVQQPLGPPDSDYKSLKIN